jgi:uncharacterized protein YfiM (DUF2279 family)
VSTTVFDLITDPKTIQPPWGFLSLFWGASAALMLITAAAWRFRWRRWRRVHITIFAVLWCCGTAYASWTEIGFARLARSAAQKGSFSTVAGCLASFHPGQPYASKYTLADEVWSVAGERFEYGAGRVGFAWTRVEPLGGAVHADTFVTAAFVRNAAYGRNEILRLAVKQHACRPAPDPGFP